MGNEQIKTGLRKNLFTLILLSFSGSIIYGLPYFRLYYYDAYLDAYNLTNAQMGMLGTAYGILGLVSYLIGGVLADKFPAKKLLIVSLFATGIGGFSHLFFTSYKALVVIYAVWGFTSLLTFWPALLKVIRMQANDDEQSRAYGIFEGGRGVASALHMAIATAIFGIFQVRALPGLGITWIIVFYSVCPILCGILFMFILKEPVRDTQTKKAEKFKFSDIIRVMKLPAVWLMVIITFTTYSFNMSFYYFTPYATNVIGASAIFAAILTVLAQYCRPVASTGAGFLADKFGKAPLMIIGFITMAISTFVIILVPNFSANIRVVIMTAACIVLYLAMFSNYGVYFSMQAEGGIPIEISGVAIGIIATLGYLPEVICPIVAGNILDAFEGVTGYHLYFTGMIVLAIVGAVTCMIWMKVFRKNIKAAKEAAEAEKIAKKAAVETN